MSEERTKLISTPCSSPFVSEDAGKQWHWMMDWCAKKKFPPAQKCESRELPTSLESMSKPEIRQRAQKEWDSIKLEVVDLPSFDSQFKIVEEFYKSLPWGTMKSV